MAASFEAIDLDDDRIAGLAFDVDLRRGTRGTAWPAFSRLEGKSKSQAQ